METRPTSFWCEYKNAYPFLSRVFRQIGSIKGSSASSERIFSLAGFILCARRHNLDWDSLRAIALNHNWLKHHVV